MARAVLAAGSALWLAAGLSGLAVATVAAEAVQALLPPLSIDTDALRGAVVAISIGAIAVAACHLAVLAGIRRRRRWGTAAGVLLAGLIGMTLFALAAAAAASAAATPAAAPGLLAGMVAAGLAAACYGLAAARLVVDRRSGSAM